MDLTALATPGTLIAIRVTPKAARNAVTVRDGAIRVNVTAAPEGGNATVAAAKLLARAIGVPKSRLSLKRGATSRDKVFEVL